MGEGGSFRGRGSGNLHLVPCSQMINNRFTKCFTKITEKGPQMGQEIGQELSLTWIHKWV